MQSPCNTCDAHGAITVLLNEAEVYFDGDEPITKNKPCEDCGGEGYINQPAQARPTDVIG